MQLILEIENSSYVLVLVIEKLLVAFANIALLEQGKQSTGWNYFKDKYKQKYTGYFYATSLKEISFTFVL